MFHNNNNIDTNNEDNDNIIVHDCNDRKSTNGENINTHNRNNCGK